MHSHVIRTTTRELAETLDRWAAASPSGQIAPHYCGGRDWVVTVIHTDHPEHSLRRGAPCALGHPREESPEALDEIGRGGGEPVVLDGAQVGPIRVEKATGTPLGGSVVLPSEHSVMIEDEARTWIMWCHPNGRPSAMWLRRESGGAVVEPGIRFRDDLPGGPGQIEMTNERHTAPGDPAGPGFAHPQHADEALPAHARSYGPMVDAPDYGTDYPFRLLYADGRTQFLTYRPVMGPGDVLLGRTDDGWRVVDHDDKGRPSSAEAYTDAVAALHEVTGAPLSTTLGHLIRSGFLAPVRPPTGRYTVRWEDGGITVDSVPTPDRHPIRWEPMRYMPVHGDLPYVEAMRSDLVSAVIATIVSITGAQVDEA